MKQFKTESKKLLDLMINSIYTNKEIFLRELISNASDALDKLNFESLTNPDLNVDHDKLAITLAFDKDARTLTISDTGIGMSKDELDKNLGTIAHSGSEQFKEENAEHTSDDVSIIGQFGVGFYSAFMVAEKVRVISRAFGADEAFAWESDGVKGYTIEPAAQDERPSKDDHGTDVILYLRKQSDTEDTDQFLSEWGLRDLVKKYSNYVRYPIQMMVTKSRQKPKPEDAGDDYKPEYEDYQELETINSMTPIWKKRAADVEQSDYNEFYKASFHDFVDPARTISFHAEGTLSYDALLFIPDQAPFDLYSKDYEKGLALYTNNVLIQEKCADLLPDYYNFVRGIVDSPDVKLNVSRETLQQNAQLRAIARRVEKKIHSELEAMRDNDREAYEKFFTNFGRGIKFGIYSSYGSKASDLADLLLFWSAKSERMVTFKEYVDAMAEGQDKIYYASGESRELVSQTPAVRGALAHGYDVLICTEDVDEFMFQFMHSYHVDAKAGDSENAGAEARDIELANVADADLDLATEDEKKEAEQINTDNADLFSALKDALGDKVSEVKASASLDADTPAMVSSTGPISLDMERRLQDQAQAMGGAPKAERVLMLNSKHPVFEKLKAVKDDADKLKLYGHILYDQALLIEGLPIDDPIEFARDVTELM
ncbi:MAG: molecular chaperone HtpG [Atopobiaceae bacterium]